VYWLWEPFIGIETSHNPGALFGYGAGNSHWFALLSVVAAVGIVSWLSWGRAVRDRWLTVALGCVMAGVFGNLYDRLGLWHLPGTAAADRYNVRDWILFRYHDYVWPNFNIADSLLVCGAAILVVHAFLQPVKPETPAPAE
jgi:signal peptidase II